MAALTTVVLAGATLDAQQPTRPMSPQGSTQTQVLGKWTKGEHPSFALGRENYIGGRWIEITYGRPLQRGRDLAAGVIAEDPMRIGSFVIAALLAATSALAHHSNSAFDGDKVMVLTGTVTEWKWTNPHVWIFLSVDDGNGGKVQWEIEGRTPGQLVRAGWSRTTLRVGETITVDFSPAKDGTRTGLLTRVRRADGTVVGQAPPAAQ